MAAALVLAVACFGFWEYGHGSGDCTRLHPARALGVYLNRTIVPSDVPPAGSPDVLFVSVFAPQDAVRDVLRRSRGVFRIYYSGENQDHSVYEHDLELALGFRCPSAVTTPCIVLSTTLFERFVTDDCALDIDQDRGEGEDAWTQRRCLASLVSGHGGYPREELYAAFSKVGKVEASGSLLHNTDLPAAPHFSDGMMVERARVAQKLNHVRQCKFSICPENAKGVGYVTEKVFEAAKAGAVPVYWGGERWLHGIINPERVLFVEDVDTTLAVAQALLEDEAARAEFFRRPLLLPTANASVRHVCDSLARHVGAWLDGIHSV